MYVFLSDFRIKINCFLHKKQFRLRGFGFISTLLLLMVLGSPKSLALKGAVYAPNPRQRPPKFSHKTLDSFNSFRYELLNLIGGAKKKIWVVTDYLTDGEIVTALYLAKYRKIDVRVLLGAKKAKMYMSRLGYLKKQGILTYLKPTGFDYAYPSGILIDDSIYKLDSDLNSLNDRRSISIIAGRPQEGRHFIQSFLKAIKNPIPAIPAPLPKVGRPRGGGGRYKYGMRIYRPHRRYKGEKDGSYNYDATAPLSAKPPPGVSTRLPTATIDQIRKRQKYLDEQKAKALREGSKPHHVPSRSSDEKESVDRQESNLESSSSKTIKPNNSSE